MNRQPESAENPDATVTTAVKKHTKKQENSLMIEKPQQCRSR